MNYDIDGMRKDLVEFGDFTKQEVKTMSASEVLREWVSLPSTVIWGEGIR